MYQEFESVRLQEFSSKFQQVRRNGSSVEREMPTDLNNKNVIKYSSYYINVEIQ